MNLRDYLPSDWECRPAWSLLELRDEMGGDGPLLSLSAALGIRERTEGEGRAASDDTSGYRVVRVGDIVINRLVARDGAMALSTLDGLVSPAYWVFKPSERLDSRFLNYLLHSSPYLAEIAARSKFMPPAQFDLPWEQFRTLPIPCPDLSLQRRLADFLDGRTYKIDTLIAKRSRSIELLEELRRSIVLEHVEGPKRPSGFKLRHVSRLIRGSGFPPNYQGRDEGDLPFFKVADLSRPGNDPYLVQCENWVSYEDAATLRASIVPPGSILFPKIGAALLGTVRRIATVPSLCDNNILAAVPTSIEDRYLRYWLSTVDLAEVANPGPVPSLDDDALKDLVVPLVDSQHQQAVADHLDSVSRQTYRAAAQARRQVDLLREHRQALVTTAVTGRLKISGEAA